MVRERLPKEEQDAFWDFVRHQIEDLKENGPELFQKRQLKFLRIIFGKNPIPACFLDPQEDDSQAEAE